MLVDEVAGLPGNPRVFFDVDIDGKRVGRIEMELFASLCPKTCENFRCLCTGERGVGLSDVPLWFKGNVFHRVAWPGSSSRTAQPGGVLREGVYTCF